MNSYLVTIKSRGDPYTPQEELLSFFYKAKALFNKSDWSSFLTFELPKSKRYHLHTIVHIPKNVFRKRLLSKLNTKRMYMYLKPFPTSDYAKVQSYILKDYVDSFEEEQNKIINYYLHNYGFINAASAKC